MKNLNKQELQQNACNLHQILILKDFMKLYKEYTAKAYSFLVIDTILALDNLLHFRANCLQGI